MADKMRTRDVLEALEFDAHYNTLSEQRLGYVFDFGNLQLKVAEVTNEYLRPVLFFTGVGRMTNSLHEVIFEMPLEVASFEQGVAWVVYGIGTDFKPLKAPTWWRMGLGWQDYLPWNIDAAKFAARPHCSVKRSWARTVLKHLRELAKTAGPEAKAQFRFDGEILRVHANGELIAVPAEGRAWGVIVSMPLARVDQLPKRLMQEVAEVAVWDDCLRYGNRAIKLDQGEVQAVVVQGAAT